MKWTWFVPLLTTGIAGVSSVGTPAIIAKEVSTSGTFLNSPKEQTKTLETSEITSREHTGFSTAIVPQEGPISVILYWVLFLIVTGAVVGVYYASHKPVVLVPPGHGLRPIYGDLCGTMNDPNRPCR